MRPPLSVYLLPKCSLNHRSLFQWGELQKWDGYFGNGFVKPGARFYTRTLKLGESKESIKELAEYHSCLLLLFFFSFEERDAQWD